MKSSTDGLIALQFLAVALLIGLELVAQLAASPAAVSAEPDQPVAGIS